MSYDFQLLPRNKVDAYLQRYEEQDAESAEINPGPVVPEREEWKRRLQEALIAEDPRLAPFSFAFDEIARIDSITEEDAWVRYRHVELNLPEEDGTGIQITISDDTATVTVPYWHEGAAAAAAFQQLWRYLGVMERVGSLAIYDPQVERVLNLTDDFDTVLSRYLGVVVRIPDLVARYSTAKKPWWKFW